MDERSRPSRLLSETTAGAPYYGPSLVAALDGVPADVAAQKPSQVHSIWELVAHISSELRYSSSLLLGRATAWMAGETTWLPIQDQSQPAWDSALVELREAAGALIAAVSDSSNDMLAQTVPGYSISFYEMIAGSAQHAAYHAGQIVLLKRLVLGAKT